MKLPLWVKIGKKYYPLTHFPDGNIGITMEDAKKFKLNKGRGKGMGKLDPMVWMYTGWHNDCFVMREPRTMIPIWFKDRNGKYHTLTHYPDGEIGMPSKQAANISFRQDSGLFYNDFTYDPVQSRYLLRSYVRNQLRNRNQET